ncbi:hypothetical protein N7532_009056 [Penicillium argentinense]|uniref:Uncharacterized protein n=1 Tax=Penicillium argentinense TaxID=1131581 RepID=A0A9W9EYJ5_9EURO|nr:uncharacterized protein N7532_009056 [Penicillium argentinense]KAJ5090372.1 hypothetical protein N7532_009056 [Penicillium argentinense]
MSRNIHLRLPVELIDIIAQFLALKHPPTLFNLALTSKTFYAHHHLAIKSIVYHDILIKIPRDEKKIGDVVSDLVQKLHRTDSFRYVRRVFLVHGRLGYNYGTSMPSEDRWNPPQLSDLRRERHPDQYTTHVGGRDLYGESWGYHPESMWKPVVDLIKQLPALKDLIWHYPEQFPASILETLHRDQPQCLLHLDCFWLRSQGSPETDPGELAILTSPSLHTLAPNLKEVHLPDSTLEEPPKQGLKHPPRPASLERFKVSDGFGSLTRSEDACIWRQYINFAASQELEIDLPSADYESFWQSQVMDLSFPALRSLTLDIGRMSSSTQTMSYYEKVTSFLQGLPPLVELNLNRWHSLIPIESIARRHGPRIQKLRLMHPFLSQGLNEQEICQISKYCLILKELAITINRTQGNLRELALYRALGAIKDLRHLDLDYETSLTAEPHGVIPRETVISPYDIFENPRSQELPADPSFDGFDNEFCEGSLRFNFRPRNGHIRKMIIDSIIDEKLAREIFDCISSTKPRHSLPLKELTLKINRMDIYESSCEAEGKTAKDFQETGDEAGK